jgi:hypothetical protein
MRIAAVADDTFDGLLLGLLEAAPDRLVLALDEMMA